MKKYLIKWDAGYGESQEVISAESQKDADTWAYEIWKEEAENNADYIALELTPEVAEEHDLEDELE